MHCRSAFLLLFFAGSASLSSAQRAAPVKRSDGWPAAKAPGAPVEDDAPGTHTDDEAPPEGRGNCGVAYCGYIVAKGKPLAGAAVAVKGSRILVVTNSIGFFTLPDELSSYPTLQINAAGYAPLAYAYQACKPASLEMVLLPNIRFKKHGRRKGYLIQAKHHEPL